LNGSHEKLAKRVGYLTVHESSHVPAGISQRRPGLHTEGFTREPNAAQSGQCHSRPYWHGWGFGEAIRPGHFEGGLFLASTVDDSCHVYDVLVPPDLVGRGGDVEHLRPTLERHMPSPAKPRTRRANELCANPGSDPGGTPVGDAHRQDVFGERINYPISIQANELFWMTDRTPHASMPLKAGTPRQFFRLVAGDIDRWYAAHSTPNPLGTQPKAQIVDYDKFTGRPVAPAPPVTSTTGDGHLSPMKARSTMKLALISWAKMRKALQSVN